MIIHRFMGEAKFFSRWGLSSEVLMKIPIAFVVGLFHEHGQMGQLKRAPGCHEVWVEKFFYEGRA